MANIPLLTGPFNPSNSTLNGLIEQINAAIDSSGGSASQLSPGADINGVLFTGASNIIVPAASDTLTGTTLASNITDSSLTSVGTLSSLHVSGGLLRTTSLQVDGAMSSDGGDFTSDGNGNVHITQTMTAAHFVGDGSGLTGLPSGTVTSITAGTGLSGGTITNSGTIAIAASTANTLAGYNNSGVFSDVTIGTNLTLSGGVLNASGGGGGGETVVLSGNITADGVLFALPANAIPVMFTIANVGANNTSVVQITDPAGNTFATAAINVGQLFSSDYSGAPGTGNSYSYAAGNYTVTGITGSSTTVSGFLTYVAI